MRGISTVLYSPESGIWSALNVASTRRADLASLSMALKRSLEALFSGPSVFFHCSSTFSMGVPKSKRSERRIAHLEANIFSRL